MRQLYTIFIRAYGTGIRLVSIRNSKASRWIKGRRKWKRKLADITSASADWYWFHAASLGEAEQGLPVMQRLKKEIPDSRIILTFFSPSGHEHFKNDAVDATFYLPLDTPYNARRFVEILKPKLAFFIKYEIWFNFLKVLKESEIPVILAPALFRSDQIYFNIFFQSFALPVLRKVDAILLQDKKSFNLLKSNDFKNIGICGDTRIDRVKEVVNQNFENELIENFTRDAELTIVAGSTWKPDEKLLRQLVRNLGGIKLILAPHDLRKEHLEELKREYKGTYNLLSSGKAPGKRVKVLIIDNMGMLSKLYRYGDVAYIGGGFGEGLHNTIEAVAYGIPVIFGPNHRNFVEPGEMIQAGFGHEINSLNDLLRIVERLKFNREELQKQSETASNYIEKKAGAVEIIWSKVEEVLGRKDDQ